MTRMPHPSIGYRSMSPLAFRSARQIGLALGMLMSVYIAVWVIFLVVNPNGPDPIKTLESEQWIATSHSWIDRVACRRLGICGGPNWLLSTWLFQPRHSPSSGNREHHHESDWMDSTTNSEDWIPVKDESRAIPSFVFDHAPLIWLHDDERWWPTDVADFLHHVEHVHTGSTKRGSAALTNMKAVLRRQELPGESYFESTDDPETLPDWLTSDYNAPKDLYSLP